MDNINFKCFLIIYLNREITKTKDNLDILIALQNASESGIY